jgi:TPR repeat protein
MKHSVFFAGQLPLCEKNIVDIPATNRLVGASVLQRDLEETVHNLLEGLSIQKLILKREDGSYAMNTKYEKSLLKVRKIVNAWQLEKDQIPEEELSRVKKMYQTGTRYYHSGDFEEAAAAFMNTIEMAEYRMGYYSMALMYRDGKGVEQSDEQALLYARAAIARGARIAEALEEDILNSMG